MILTDFFKDLTVVELAGVLAGPAVGMFFAELGARVIKVENKTTGGDMTRQWKLPVENPESPFSAYYAAINWHKEVLMKDLSDPQDNNEVLGLLHEADIVICNFKKSSAQKLHMDPASLHKLNPNLIYAQIDAFPDDEERPGFDIVLQAEAGFLFMNGEPGREPVKMPVALIDILAAHQLKEAILIALLNRQKHGMGCYVSVSLLEAAISSLANQATNWLMGNHIPQRMGALHPNIAPYGEIFYTKDDKPLVLAVGTSRQFLNLCTCLGIVETATDQRFASNTERVKNRHVLKEILQERFYNWERNELMAALRQNGVPAGSVLNMQEVFQNKVAKDMVLDEIMADGTISKRVRTAAFYWD